MVAPPQNPAHLWLLSARGRFYLGPKFARGVHRTLRISPTSNPLVLTCPRVPNGSIPERELCSL